MAALLGPLEQTVMDVLWEKHPQTVRQLVEKVCQDRPLAYTTIQTIVTRLCQKGLLEKTVTQGHHQYAPVASKKEFLRGAWRSTFRQFFDRFGTEAVTAFAEEFGDLDNQERQHLQSLLGKTNE